MFNFINSFFSSTNKTGLENDSEILNLTNGLNTTKFLLDTAHQKEEFIHKFEFLNFLLLQNELKYNYWCAAFQVLWLI